ncbi:MAG: DUF6580 family putative transport protein [bacterium]
MVGLSECYISALPFYGATLVSTFAFSFLIWGVFGYSKANNNQTIIFITKQLIYYYNILYHYKYLFLNLIYLNYFLLNILLFC